MSLRIQQIFNKISLIKKFNIRGIKLVGFMRERKKNSQTQ